MPEISLSKGYSALVDDEDFAAVSAHRWCITRTKYCIYAKSTKLNTKMHIFIMQPTKGLVVHHRDGNGLNNSRSNLVVTTQGANVLYSKPREGRVLPRGVYWHERAKRYTPRIGISYKYKYLGLFDSIAEAEAAYKKAAEELLRNV